MDWIEQELAGLERAAALRSLRVSTEVPAYPGYLLREDSSRPLLNLSANDYLGLSQHPAILEVMQAALLRGGAGAGASRFVTGNRPGYDKLEQAISEWQGSEAALVFANGYMANTGVIQAVVGRDDVVFSDRLNHASIVDGILLSRAKLVRYSHNDMNSLEALLYKFRDRRRKLIVTDSVFSMDGDQAHLQELALLKREHGAMLMVDEAHSGGVYGRCGEGLCHVLGMQDAVDIHLGTFSKAFGVYGAYVCGSRRLIDYLINQARPLIYSTALPPSVLAGLAQALTLVSRSIGAVRHCRRQHGVFALR